MTNLIDVISVFIFFIFMIFYALIYQRDEWIVNKWYRYEYIKPEHKSLLELRKEYVKDFAGIEEDEDKFMKIQKQVRGTIFETAPQSSLAKGDLRAELGEGDANQ
jgi:hypothetical protein